MAINNITSTCYVDCSISGYCKKMTDIGSFKHNFVNCCIIMCGDSLAGKKSISPTEICLSRIFLPFLLMIKHHNYILLDILIDTEFLTFLLVSIQVSIITWSSSQEAAIIKAKVIVILSEIL